MAIAWTISADDTETTFNFYVERGINCGYPEPNNIITPYGLADGAYFQRQVYGARSFALQGQLIVDTYLQFHQFRQLLIDHIQRDIAATITPLTITYEVDGTVLKIYAYYQGGLEGDGDLVGFTEKMTLRFLAVDPYWKETSDDTAALGLSAATTFNFLARNTALGAWSNMVEGVDGGSHVVYAIVENATDVYVGGSFATAGNPPVTCTNIARYDKALGTWNPLEAGVNEGCDNNVNCMALDSTGLLYIGGDFTTAGATTVNKFCSYDKGTDTFARIGPAGTYGANGAVYAMSIDNADDIYFGGSFTTVDGVAGFNYLAKWTGAAYVQMGTGAAKGTNGSVRAMTFDDDNTIYYGGLFTKINGAATTCYGLGGYNITTGALSVIGTNGVAYRVNALAYGLGNLWIGVDMDTALGGGEIIYGLARWDGISFIQYYITTGGGGAGATLKALCYDTTNNYLFVGGEYDAINGNTGYSVIAYLDEDYSWHNTEINFGLTRPAAGDAVTAISAYNGIINYGWTDYDDASRTIFLPVSTIIANTGTASTFPIFEIEGAGDAVKITNITTGDVLAFSGLTLAASETLTIDLTQGNKSMTTNLRGANITRYLSNNSNFGTFRLLPGNNTLSLQVEDTCAAADVTWTPQHWSFDAAG